MSLLFPFWDEVHRNSVVWVMMLVLFSGMPGLVLALLLR